VDDKKVVVSYDAVLKPYNDAISMRTRLMALIKYHFQEEHANTKMLAMLSQTHATNEALIDMYDVAIDTKYRDEESGEDKVVFMTKDIPNLASLTLILLKCTNELTMSNVSVEIN
tara:strand:+ start:330 stop:674 length:345 start_codon:yes stop_codon:yes gene_type:complete